jgi:RecA-family ATPase
MHHRVNAALKYHDLSYDDIKGRLFTKCIPDDDAALARVDGKGAFNPTPLYRWLENEAARINPKLIILEALVDLFDADEIKRRQVRLFVKLMRRLAMKIDGAVLLIGHPSVAGMKDRTGLSGSTDWHNAVRARLYFRKPPKPRSGNGGDGTMADPGAPEGWLDDATAAEEDSMRCLEVMKNQFGPPGEIVPLVWEDGVYVKPGARSAHEVAADKAKAESTFLAILEMRTSRNLFHSNDKCAKTYAPRIFASLAEAHGLKERDLESAMERLEAANRIAMVPHPRISAKKRADERRVLAIIK